MHQALIVVFTFKSFEGFFLICFFPLQCSLSWTYHRCLCFLPSCAILEQYLQMLHILC